MVTYFKLLKHKLGKFDLVILRIEGWVWNEHTGCFLVNIEFLKYMVVDFLKTLEILNYSSLDWVFKIELIFVR